MNRLETKPMQQGALPPPLSVTHLHLLGALNTRLQGLDSRDGVIRICDVGCGKGTFLAYLATCLPILNPGMTFEFHGLEVSDSGVQPEGFFETTLKTLGDSHPGVDWRERLCLVGSTDAWPFPDGHFHAITSNQVLEHVHDHALLFAEIHRTLVDAGVSLHLFPLKHYIWEGHLFYPFVHRIRQHSAIRRYIELCSRLGLGLYKEHRLEYGMTLAHFAEEHADYMSFMTNYLTSHELLRFCKLARLRADYSYTKEFYKAKLRMMLRRPARYLYPRPRPIWDTILFFFLKRVSSITLCLEKKNIYAR